VTVKAIKNGVHTYCDRYCWSGKGRIEINCGNPEHIFTETGRVNTYQLFEIKLGKTLKKNQTEKIEINWNLEDKAGCAEPFLATTLHEPTNNLTLTVSLRQTKKVKHAIYTERLSSSMRDELDLKEVPFNGGVATILIQKPKLLHYYELRWRF
jgi:hypothetical protein